MWPDLRDLVYFKMHVGSVKQIFYVKFKYFHTDQCKRTGGCYNELVVAFSSTGSGVKGEKIYTC